MKKAGPAVIAAVMVAAVLAATILICRHAGLRPDLDFGCGQYYYTDIPNWEKYFSVQTISDRCPKWAFHLLFFSWGYAMYRLWKWIDRRS